MKLERTFQSLIDMGFFDGFGIGDALKIGASLYTGAQNRKTQERINEQNIALQRETNAMQQEMFNQNLDWQRESQEIQNEYNALDSQVARALSAGVSPSAILGSGSTPAGTGASGSSIPALTAPHEQMIDDVGTQSIRNFSQIAKSISDLSSSGLADAQKSEIVTLLQDKLRNLQLDADAKKFALSMEIKFQDKERQARYDLLIAEHGVKLSEIQLNKELSATEKEKQMNLVSQSLYTDVKRLLSKKELSIFDERWEKEKQVLESQVKLNTAKQSEAYSVAENQHEQAVDTRQTRQSRIALNESIVGVNNSLKELNNTRNSFEVQTLQTRILTEFEKLSQNETLSDRVKTDLKTAVAHMEQAMYDNNHKSFTYWKNFFCDAFNTSANVTRANSDALRSAMPLLLVP